MAVMRQWQRPLEFDRPTFDMLRFNNIYTNSRKDFRWRHCPNVEEGTLTASVYTTKCFECADDVVSRDFPLTEEGFEESKEWIESKFREFVEANPNRY